MRSRTRSLLVGVTAGLAATAAAGVAATRRWTRADDPTGGQPLCLPDGTDEVVATSDGGKLQVRVAGPADGPLVVLVHCWTGDRRVWGPVARRLVEAGRRVVLYDHRGHGGSTIGEDGVTLDALAADLRAVLDHVDAREAVVAGHSMGGMTAQLYACEHADHMAEHVRGLVIVSSACDEIGRGGWHTRLANATIDLPWTDRVLAVKAIAPFFVRRTVGSTASMAHLDAVIDTLLATPPKVRRDALTSMQALDLGEHLAAIDVPVSVVVGSRDQLTPPARSRRICERIPHATLRTIPDRGHMLPIEAPDELTAILQAASLRDRTDFLPL